MLVLVGDHHKGPPAQIPNAHFYYRLSNNVCPDDIKNTSAKFHKDIKDSVACREENDHKYHRRTQMSSMPRILMSTIADVKDGKDLKNLTFPINI